MDILLVEDNEINRKLVIDLLKHAGHQVRVAENGQIALDILADDPFDLILMDMQMPVMDGYKATREIRKCEERTGCHTPILAMTAYAMVGDQDKCIEAGADAYMSKPIRPSEFMKVVSQLQESGKIKTAIEEAPVDEESADTPLVFDAKKSLARLMGKEALLKEITAMFLDQYQDHLARIESAVASGVATDIGATAHAFKGAIGNFVAPIAFQAALDLENMGRSGELEGVDQAFGKLKGEVESLIAFLDRFNS